MTIPQTDPCVDLRAVQFSSNEVVLASVGSMSVSAFRYASGVAALRVRNKVGEAVVLPFHGQQIWDAQFYGRRLTMRSVFPDPVASTEYLNNYGGFLVHCGALAMGNPGPRDTHPLHGELPNAQFQEAYLTFGTDGQGAPYVGIGGTYRHQRAFTSDYVFAPLLRFSEASGRIDLSLSVENHRSKPMDLMYLAHINFRPIDGARIVDATPDENTSIRLRRQIPEFFTPEASYVAFAQAVAAEPVLHRELVADRRIDPEFVFGIDCIAGADGWTHALQLLPDGTADFVSHRADQLDRAVRWMTRNGDEDALGLMMPSTAEAEGHEAETRKGNVRKLARGEKFTCTLSFGALTAAEAQSMLSLIEAARPAVSR